MHRAADRQETPARTSIWPLRRTCQLWPSHCSDRLSNCVPCGASYCPLPTATQPSVTGHDTLPSVFPSGNGPGAASTCQAVPFHRSVRTRTGPKRGSPVVPTAMQLAALLQETPARLLPLAPAGTAAASKLQLCPSHCSARAAELRPSTTFWSPTAMQLLALAHEIPDSAESPEPRDGVGSTCQVVPSHTSASGTLALPGKLVER